MDPSGVIDLRSDTFTVPDGAMRARMADAAVGDDVWGEDPTVLELERCIAARLRKEAAMFTPSGTMANLCALLAQTSPGDEVVIDAEAHIVVHEVAGAAVVGGLQLRTVDAVEGVPTAEQVRAAARPADIHQPRSRVLALENTHNRRGGLAVDVERVSSAASAARDLGLRVHCDGARLFNAAVALGVEAAVLVEPCDTVSICFSKGLGAPVGSALVGDADTIAIARRWRKRLGGGMRQAGIIAAAALDALERNIQRLAVDHENAAALARGLEGMPGISVTAVPVPTNIVLLRTRAPASEVAAQARGAGVLLTVMDSHLVRAMTYLGVDDAMCAEAVARLRGARVSAIGEPISGALTRP